MEALISSRASKAAEEVKSKRGENTRLPFAGVLEEFIYVDTSRAAGCFDSGIVMGASQPPPHPTRLRL